MILKWNNNLNFRMKNQGRNGCDNLFGIFKMKKLKSILGISVPVFAVTILMNSCTSVNDEELRWQVIYCEDSLVSFQSSILPMMNTSCNSCHSSSERNGNVILDNYTEVKKYASNGALMGVINHSPGFSPMPIGKPKWNECRIHTLQKWIDEGMQNN